MAHFSLLWPSGLDFEGILPSSDMEALDARVTACLHEGGGNWTFSAATNLLGSQPFNVTTLAVPSGGTFTLGGTQWPVLGARDFDRWEHADLLGIGGGGPWQSELWNYENFSRQEGALFVMPHTTGGDFKIRIPIGPVNSELKSVHVVSFGDTGHLSGTLNVGSFQIMRQSLGDPVGIVVGTDTAISSAQADNHNTGNWTTFRETIITPTTTHVFTPGTALYSLKVARPYNTTSGASMGIIAVGCRFGMTALRP